MAIERERKTGIDCARQSKEGAGGRRARCVRVWNFFRTFIASSTACRQPEAAAVPSPSPAPATGEIQTSSANLERCPITSKLKSSTRH